MIPPPIVQSTYEPPRKAPAGSALIEKPKQLDDRQQELEADLQYLLDAQAEGFIRGLEGGSVEDRSSTGSTTPTVQSVKDSSTGRARKAVRRRPGLRSARKGIYNSMIALTNLKEEELQDIDTQITSHAKTLSQIETWEQKRRGLREASQHVDSGEETVRVQRLREEAETMQAEINRIEVHLEEMKTRQRKLLRQAAAADNAIQAKMASYTNSMRLLEEDIQKFLAISPGDAEYQPPPAEGKASVWQLPPKRRNLDLAKDYWAEQRQQRYSQRLDIEHEISALEEGAQLWRETVQEVNDFERSLRTEMAALPSSPTSQSAWEEPQSQSDSAEKLKELLGKMETVIESLHIKLQIVEERNWRLLVAAIGAELDALRRGKQILSGALNASAADEQPDATGDESMETTSNDEIKALDQSFATARNLENHASDGDDEEPPPELLFSQARE